MRNLLHNKLKKILDKKDGPHIKRQLSHGVETKTKQHEHGGQGTGREVLFPHIQAKENAGLVFTDQMHAESVNLQLRILKHTLKLTTAALLVGSRATKELVLKGIATERNDIATGPYNLGRGITGAMYMGKPEVKLCPVKNDYNGIPYYVTAGGVGCFYSLVLPYSSESTTTVDPFIAILCVDKTSTEAWTEDEMDMLRLTARKLSLELQANDSLVHVENEKNVIQKICLGLRELNRGLGLESVFESTIKAVLSFVQADFICISLLEEDVHVTTHVYGKNKEYLCGLEYSRNDGLIGQVIKLNHPLPANGSYHGPIPLFSSKKPLIGFDSLWVMPLRTEESEPFGALSVAAKEAQMFSKDRQEILGLIADQVAIKIDLAKAHEKISKLATTDGLTELSNHRTFQHGFDVMLHRARRRKSPLSLLFCDLDHFKKINDTYGHQFGDEILRSVANVLKNTVRKEDMAARYGGEEFAIILENSDIHGALLMAERIRQDITDLKLKFEGKIVKSTISIGVSSYPVDALEKAELIELADQALYEAKKEGRNRTVAWKTLTKKK